MCEGGRRNRRAPDELESYALRQRGLELYVIINKATWLETKLTYIQANLRTTVGFNVESWIETDRARQRPGR